MPSSNKEGKAIIREWLSEFNTEVHQVLDLGVGEGTYKRLFARKSHLLENAVWHGIEAWAPYIEKFELTSFYDNIIHDDIRSVDYSIFKDIDLVFAGDVLEHITKEESIEVINKLISISKRIIISIPIVHYPQGEVENNPFEIHVKDDWSHEEVMETFPHIRKHWQGNTIGVYLIEV